MIDPGGPATRVRTASGRDDAQRPAEPWRDGSGRAALALTAAILAVATLVVFGGFLFGSEGRIPSSPRGDTARYFVFAREFAATQLLQGNLPLWNPHTFSGAPFVGAFQASVLYPSSAVHLLLPLERALGVEFALATFLLGFFVAVWLSGWGLHPAATLLAALSAAFGGVFFLRVLAGALTVLHTFAWLPLVLACIDRLAGRPSWGWTLVGIAAVSLMILAGHPPSAFMAGLTAMLYAGPALWRSRERWRGLGQLALVATAPLCVTAVQLWTGLDVAGEASRQDAVSLEFATSFSLPPESLLTAFAPGLFGDETLYLGRWFYWDDSAYIGLVPLLIAVHGAFAGRGELRRRSGVLLVVLVVLALGRYTPLYALLHSTLPGFGYMRAPSKFMFFASVFAAALAGIGMDRLLRDGARAGRTAVFALACGLVLAGLAFAVWRAGSGVEPAAPMRWLAAWAGRDSVSPLQRAIWYETLLRSLIASSAFAAVASLLLSSLRRWRAAGFGLVALAAIELLGFARANVGSIAAEDPTMQPPPGLLRLYQRAGHERVFSRDRRPNRALTAGGYGLWGYDSVVLARYLEFMAFTQGAGVEGLDNVEGSEPTRFHPLFAMLRTRYSIDRRGAVREHPEALPRFALIRSHRVLGDRASVLAAMASPEFDPRTTVLLEREPEPGPAASGGAGRVELLSESTDHLDLEVEIPTPAILLVTDSYSSGWRARPLAGSIQQEYQVLPANLVLRAIPLDAGRHRLRLEYSPWAFRAGRWASAVSGLVLGASALAWGWRARTAASGPEAG
jgi:hypothetical protein